MGLWPPIPAAEAQATHKSQATSIGRRAAWAASPRQGTFAPVYDAQKRPITAGGFVDDGPVVFEDATKAAGLCSWQHVMGTQTKKYILETDGSGVGLIDYDNDGWLDIYLVNGSTYDALDGQEDAAACRAVSQQPRRDVYRCGRESRRDQRPLGIRRGHRRLSTTMAGPISLSANFGKNRLYHNNHNGTFTDVAEKAGVTLGNWSDGATWGDYDGDGRLDLFVSGYVHYDLNASARSAADGIVPFAFCQLRGVPVMCGPRGLQGRARSSLSQQWRWHVYRCQREGRRVPTRTTITASPRSLSM